MSYNKFANTPFKTPRCTNESVDPPPSDEDTEENLSDDASYEDDLDAVLQRIGDLELLVTGLLDKVDTLLSSRKISNGNSVSTREQF